MEDPGPEHLYTWQPRFAPAFLKHCQSKNSTLDLWDISEHHSPPTSQLPASLLDACGQGGQTTRTTLQKKRRKRKKKSAVMTWTMKTTWRALPGQITHARTANYTFRTQEPGNLCATSTAGPKPSAAAAAAFQQFSSNRLITHSARADLAKSRDSLRTSTIGPGTSAPVPGACQDSPCQSILQHEHDKRPHTRTTALQQHSRIRAAFNAILSGSRG